MSNKQTSDTGGLVLGMLGVLFVGLKLTGYINWSWWYVTMPFWGGMAIVAAILLFAVGCYGIVGVVEYFNKRR